MWFFKDEKQNSGKRAELGAASLLRRQGLKIITTNYSCRSGEIDIIAQQNDELVFVEVRYRARSDFGTGCETVDRHKQKKLISAARHYLAANSLEVNCRFDVIEVSGSAWTYHWIKHAFEEQAWTWK